MWPSGTLFSRIHLKELTIMKNYSTNFLKFIPIYIQKAATLKSLFISEKYSIYFRWYIHASSGAHTTVSTVSVICNTVTATYCYRGGVGTGLSVLCCAKYKY
jgi:hypothetical protein